ncbi:MAG: GNAT family N-acetyltransferase [Pyrinomonadaceae bacterium]
MNQGGEGEWPRGEYSISTDNERLDVALIHDFISNQSYWGQGRRIETVQRALNHSLNFGVFKNDQQVGFARVVTDFATFAWVADVFILADHRGQGLAKWLMESILSHPELQGFRRWVLATRDAHSLVSRNLSGQSVGWNAPIRKCRKRQIIGKMPGIIEQAVGDVW